MSAKLLRQLLMACENTNGGNDLLVTIDLGPRFTHVCTASRTNGDVIGVWERKFTDRDWTRVGPRRGATAG